MLVECFLHLFRPSTERGCFTQFRTIQKRQTVVNTWGPKMHNCTSLSAAPVSLEEFRENTEGWAISEDRPCEQLLVLSIANCDAKMGE